MPIDIQKKLIFVHVPKTGGTTVEVLFNFRRIENWFSFRPAFTKYDCTPQHLFVSEIRELLGQDIFNQCHSFGFTRNPWDRLLSEYFYIKRLMAGRSKKGKKLVELLPAFDDFDYFVKYVTNFSDQEKLNTYDLFDRHLYPQYKFLDGCKDIRDYENFQQEVEALCLQFGTPYSNIQLNKGPQRDYRQFYTDDLAELVSEFYAEDIRRFGYSFL